MERKLFEVEYRPGEELVLRFRPPKPSIVSEEAKEHFKAAHKEMLLSLRNLVDKAIEHVEQAEKEATPKTRTKVKVE
jgi:hypothetical protein